MNGARDDAFSEQKNPKILKITRVDCSRHVLELIPSTWRKVTQKAWCKWGKNMTLSLISACFGIKYLGRIPPSGRVDDSRVNVIPFDSEVWGGFNNCMIWISNSWFGSSPTPTWCRNIQLTCQAAVQMFSWLFGWQVSWPQARMMWPVHSRNRWARPRFTTTMFLGGGNSNIFCFHP